MKQNIHIKTFLKACVFACFCSGLILLLLTTLIHPDCPNNLTAKQKQSPEKHIEFVYITDDDTDINEFVGIDSEDNKITGRRIICSYTDIHRKSAFYNLTLEHNILLNYSVLIETDLSPPLT